MASMPYSYIWRVASAPLNDAELEHYHAFQEGRFGDYFYIKVRIWHQLCAVQQQPRQFLSDPLVIYSFEGFMVLTSQEFLENGPSIMQTRFPNAILPHQVIHDMMPSTITFAKAKTMENCLSSNVPDFRLFPLVLDILIQQIYDVDYDDDMDDDIISMIMRESMEEVNMVPASKSAIESLTKVKLGIGDHRVERCCSICMVEFDDGDEEVSSMPCKHVYHEECIVQWLKISHTCPLCRYPMPTN